MTGKVSAIFLFNHKFERNVAKLEAMYADRFSTRHYIMPFATMTDDKVIPVRETSYRFSGHLAQAGERLLADDASHYVVISDDLVLNPRLNETNIVGELALGAETGYIKALAALDAVRHRWWRSKMIVEDFIRTDFYFDFAAELPDAEEAKSRFRQLGIAFDRLPPRNPVEWRRTAIERLDQLRGRRTSLPYPLLCGYADFLMIPGPAMRAFLHYCGVFASLNVFAEAAVPTALALAAREVRTELAPGELFDAEDAVRASDARWTGIEFWRPGQADAFAAHFDSDMRRLKAEFPAGDLYVHPVKLSRWH